MKTLLVMAFAALVGMTLVGAVSAQAGDRCRGGQPTTAYVAPQGTVVAQGQAGTGYRTFSYQPATGMSYQSYVRPGKPVPHLSAGQHSAGFKLTDF